MMIYVSLIHLGVCKAYFTPDEIRDIFNIKIHFRNGESLIPAEPRSEPPNLNSNILGLPTTVDCYAVLIVTNNKTKAEERDRK
jgi:hypothetical protein